MGTRHLTKVIDSTGRTRVAQYGQWDGYPDYTGAKILNFISQFKVLDQIETNLKKVHFITDEEVEQLLQGVEDINSVYPSLSRDTGCDILQVIVYSTGYTLPLVDSSDFESDTLFCEGVYTLNYQTRTFISTYGGVSVSIPFGDLCSTDEYEKKFTDLLTPTV
jgi:hypothetical protein